MFLDVDFVAVVDVFEDSEAGRALLDIDCYSAHCAGSELGRS